MSKLSCDFMTTYQGAQVVQTADHAEHNVGDKLLFDTAKLDKRF